MYTTKGIASSDVLITRHAPLVRRIALQLIARLPSSVELDDLIQAGMLGLIDAVNRFQDLQIAQFETYASQRIRGAMLDELRALDWLPRSVRSAAREIDRGLRLAESMLGRAPSEGEVAEVMGLSLAEYQKMLAEAHGGQLIHVDEWTEEDDSPYLDRQGVTSGKNPLDVLMSEGFKTSLISAIEGLPDREKLLLSLYYEQGLNLKEVGAVLDVSESRVCQLHSQAMSRLRTRMKTGAWAADDTQS